jgi:hypothetical protein
MCLGLILGEGEIPSQSFKEMKKMKKPEWQDLLQLFCRAV